MTTWREIEPIIRMPPLAETPALARLGVGLLWLVIGLFGKPLTCLFLVTVVATVLILASSHTPRALLAIAWRPIILIVFAGALAFALSLEDGRATANLVTILTVERLLLVLVVTLFVVLPQDAEAALSEAIVLLRVPARAAFQLLIWARVLTAIPGDFSAYRIARRARDMRRRGLIGFLLEPLTAVPNLVRAARRRLNALRTSAQLSALGSSSQRTVYRSVSFGRNGRYVVLGGLIIAVVSLLIGLL